jgi:hypothetical protein
MNSKDYLTLESDEMGLAFFGGKMLDASSRGHVDMLTCLTYNRAAKFKMFIVHFILLRPYKACIYISPRSFVDTGITDRQNVDI